MASEFDYFTNRRTDRTYVSKPLPVTEQEPRVKRIVYKVFDGPQHTFSKDAGSILLHEGQEGRVQICAYYYEDSGEIDRITIMTFIRGQPHNKAHFTLRGDDLRRFSAMLQAVRALPLDPDQGSRFDDEMLEGLMSEHGIRSIVENHPEIVRQVIENKLTETDIVGVAYRKKQLEVFESLMDDADFFEQKRREWEKRGPEDVWQEFFERNNWIFGYGLQYIFTSKFETAGRDTLRQMVRGSRIGESGKEADAFLKTLGVISSVCFVEIKRHDDDLLAAVKKGFRPDCWRISKPVAEAVAQSQKTVQQAVEAIRTELRIKDEKDYPTGERALVYNPKSVILIGSLSEFQREGEISQEQFGSFELFRRNLVNPQIITFDELLERARHIASHDGTTSASIENDDDSPFAETGTDFFDGFGPANAADDDVPF